MVLISKLYNIFYNKFYNFFYGKPVYKQEILLRLAIKERGLDPNKLIIYCDHQKGHNYVNGIKLNIKYPIEFFNLSHNLIPEIKTLSFYFNGNMSEKGKRKEMLKPFIGYPNSLIIESGEGRVQKNKGEFNEQYFKNFALSKFGLCPHQADWPGPIRYNWTYRFIEACMVNSIPVLFNKAPLGELFTNGFYFYNEEDFISMQHNNIPSYTKKEAQHNRNKAIENFTISMEEYQMIKDSI